LIGQPTIIQPQQVIGTPQYLPQTYYPTQPSNIYYPPQTGVISSGQVIDQGAPIEQYGSLKNVEEVEEGKIEGEVITPDDESKPSVLEKDGSDKMMDDEGNSSKMDDKDSSSKMDDEMSKADKMKADEMKADAMSAEKMKADKMKADEMSAEKMKADKMKADKMSAEKMKADKMKADEKVEEPEVLTSAQRISKLETSMKRQMARAKQVSKRDLDKALKQMKADGDDSASKIAVAKIKAQKALDDKLEAIEKRVQARIDQIDN